VLVNPPSDSETWWTSEAGLESVRSVLRPW
jgi:hypothetical protein